MFSKSRLFLFFRFHPGIIRIQLSEKGETIRQLKCFELCCWVVSQQCVIFHPFQGYQMCVCGWVGLRQASFRTSCILMSPTQVDIHHYFEEVSSPSTVYISSKHERQPEKRQKWRTHPECNSNRWPFDILSNFHCVVLCGS